MTGDELRRYHEGVVRTFHSLFKLARQHELDGEKATRGLDRASRVLEDHFRTEVNDAITLLTEGESAWVNARPLFGSRKTYGLAEELSSFLHDAELNEVTIRRGATASDLYALLEWYVYVLRKPKAGSIDKEPTKHVRLRLVDATSTLGLRSGAEPETAEEVYSAALATMRLVFSLVSVASGGHLGAVRRCSLRLLDAAERSPRQLVGLTGLRSAFEGRAARAVHAGILAAAIGRTVTRDRRTMARMVETALLLEVGRARLETDASSAKSGFFTPTRDEETNLERITDAGSVAIISLGGLGLRNVERLGAAFEANITYELGATPSYEGGMRASIEAVIAATAHKFERLLSFDVRKQKTSATIDEATKRLVDEANSAAERLVIELLFAALGFHRRGTAVQLSSGRMGVVVRNHHDPVRYRTPVVRVQDSATGRYVDVDLGAPESAFSSLGHVTAALEDPPQDLALLADAIEDEPIDPTPLMRRPRRASASSSGERVRQLIQPESVEQVGEPTMLAGHYDEGGAPQTGEHGEPTMPAGHYDGTHGGQDTSTSTSVHYREVAAEEATNELGPRATTRRPDRASTRAPARNAIEGRPVEPMPAEPIRAYAAHTATAAPTTSAGASQFEHSEPVTPAEQSLEGPTFTQLNAENDEVTDVRNEALNRVLDQIDPEGGSRTLRSNEPADNPVLRDELFEVTAASIQIPTALASIVDDFDEGEETMDIPGLAEATETE